VCLESQPSLKLSRHRGIITTVLVKLQILSQGRTLVEVGITLKTKQLYILVQKSKYLYDRRKYGEIHENCHLKLTKIGFANQS